jgi:hypothetical protein
MIIEMDKLLRILLNDGLGLDLPDGSQPFMSSVAVTKATKDFRKHHGGCEPTAEELRGIVDELTLPRGKCGVTSAQEQIAPQQMVTGV